MATLLSVRGITHARGGRTLFRNLTFGIEDADRVGMIGPNGAGKSTLLRILAGDEKPDSGTVALRRGLHVVMVPQEDVFQSGGTVGTQLAAALDGSTLDESERRARIAEWMGRCGFADPEQPVETLSGGWRKRLAIVSAALREPDILFLDEPTNHLDISGVEWLEQWLADVSFAVVVVTHDRMFLENVATRLICVDPRYPEGTFEATGGYSDFVQRQAEWLESQGRRLDGLDSDVRREVAWLRRGARARTTKAKGRIEDAQELFGVVAEMRARMKDRSRLAAEGFTASGRRSRELIVLHQVAATVEDRILFRDLDLVVGPGSKLGLVGANGAGKTTLMRMLSGERLPDSGGIKRADGLRVVWFNQGSGDLDRGATVRQTLCPAGDTVEYQGARLHVSAWAKRFGIDEGRLGAKVGTLSGGEQARVRIAQLMLQPADVLLLDEPTNDLDLETMQVLEDSLHDFGGGLVLVTHDRVFMDRVADRVLVLGEGVEPSFYADYAQYAERRAEKEAVSTGSVAKSTTPAVRPRAALTASERKELDQIEERIAVAEAAVASVEAKMLEPEIARDAQRLRDIWETELPAAKAEVDRLYARWELLESKKAGVPG
jgi:ATP-binding cassette subfamily F protein uup